MAGSGEEGTVEARQSSGRVRRSRIVALWWMLVSEREKREWKLEARGIRRIVKWVHDLNPN